MVEGSNVGLSNWEGPILSSVVSRIPYGPMGSSYYPMLSWTHSSSSECRDGDTDVLGRVVSDVAVNCLVLTGCISDIVMSSNFKRNYCLIANKVFLFHTIVDGDCLFELYE